MFGYVDLMCNFQPTRQRLLANTLDQTTLVMTDRRQRPKDRPRSHLGSSIQAKLTQYIETHQGNNCSLPIISGLMPGNWSCWRAKLEAAI